MQIGLKKHYYRAKVTKQIKKDLQVWKSFLLDYNYQTFFLDFRWQSSASLQLYSDAASTIGFGVIFGHKWSFGLWDDSCLGLNIALLELYPIVLAFHLWGDHLNNKCIIINTDNQAVVHILNYFTSKDIKIMILIRKLVLITMQRNILIKSVHLPGYLNTLSDMISRNQVQKALLLDPSLDKIPVRVPEEMRLEKWLNE